jgi:hypothetical protein
LPRIRETDEEETPDVATTEEVEDTHVEAVMEGNKFY